MAVHFKLYRQAIPYNVFDVYEVSHKAGPGRSAEGVEPDTLSQAMPQINRSITAMRNTPRPVGFVRVRTIRLHPCFESHIRADYILFKTGALLLRWKRNFSHITVEISLASHAFEIKFSHFYHLHGYTHHHFLPYVYSTPA